MLNRRVFVVALCLASTALLSGCIPVRNIVDRWQSAGADSAVEGVWLMVGEEGEEEVEGEVEARFEFAIHDKEFFTMREIPDDEPGDMAFRTFEHDGVKFLVLGQYVGALEDFNSDRFDEDVMEDIVFGGVMEYRIDGDTMTWRILREEVIQQAVENEVVAGSTDGYGTVGLDALDDETVAWLAQMFKEPDSVDEESLDFIRSEPDGE